MRRVLARYEPLLARTLSDARLAAWLTGASKVAERLPMPVTQTQPAPPWVPPAPPQPPALAGGEPEPKPVVHFPIIEAAAEDLAGRGLFTRADYDRLDAVARQEAFTVANVTSQDVLQKVQEALAEGVRQGDTFRDFQGRLDGVLDESALAPGQLETVFRTNVGQAYSRGQQELLDHPAVTSALPYVAYVAVHDSRTEDTHLAMEHHGLDGTNVYRKDDPTIRKFWAPWRWSCRCVMVALTVREAAERGVREAREWLRTGAPPLNPEWVTPPSFDLPKGWTR